MSKIADEISRQLRVGHLACHDEEWEQMITQHKQELKTMKYTTWRANEDARLLKEETDRGKIVVATQLEQIMHKNAVLHETKNKTENIRAEKRHLVSENALLRETLEKMRHAY